MEWAKLKNPYIAVMADERLSYGGNQGWGKQKSLSKYGCGVIAGTDLLLYLGLHKNYCQRKEFKTEENGIWEMEIYMEIVKAMKRKYLPVIPGLGMPGWVLSGGINRYFRINRIPLKISFGVFRRNLRNRISAMLAHDIPVILAVGPNFPIPVKKYKLPYYEKTGETYRRAGQMAAHFVTITGMEGQWVRISSWGKKYYINLGEYEEYVRKHSCFFTSNIFYVRKRCF